MKLIIFYIFFINASIQYKEELVPNFQSRIKNLEKEFLDLNYEKLSEIKKNFQNYFDNKYSNCKKEKVERKKCFLNLYKEKKIYFSTLKDLDVKKIRRIFKEMEESTINKYDNNLENLENKINKYK